MPVKHSSDSDNICVRKKEGKETLKRWILQQQREHEQHSNATTSKRMKFGVKCSEMIRKPLGIENWADISNANLIVGVRHPVEWFQSNYNYRWVERKKRRGRITRNCWWRKKKGVWCGVELDVKTAVTCCLAFLCTSAYIYIYHLIFIIMLFSLF